MIKIEKKFFVSYVFFKLAFIILLVLLTSVILLPVISEKLNRVKGDTVQTKNGIYAPVPAIVTPGSYVNGDDNYEENDTMATAYDLSLYSGQWLSAIDGLGVQADNDWYEIYIHHDNNTVQIDCRFSDSQGDIDISLYDASGNFLVSSASVTDNEYISRSIPTGGTYYIRVFYGNAGNTYDLLWDLSIPNDDLYEENDTLATAYDLSSNEQQLLSDVNGLGYQADDDWYKVYVGSGYERLLIISQFAHSVGDINVSLYDSAEALLTSSESTTDNEYIDYIVPSTSTYYIKVYGTNVGNAYNLWWGDFQPSTGDDNYEENDTLAEAYDFSTQQQKWLSTINGPGLQADDDWYEVYVPADYYERIEVKCLFTHSLGDINLNLYDSSGTLLASSESITDDEFIDYGLMGAWGTFYIHVHSGNMGNMYDLWWDDVLPADDNYEDNDTMATAYDLSSFGGQWLSSVNGIGFNADVDWYKIYVASGNENVQIDCQFSNSAGNIDIALYNSSGTLLTSSTTRTDNEYIDFIVFGGSVHYIKVYSGSYAGNAYDLWWNSSPPGDDNYEENDTLATAWYPGYNWERAWLHSYDGPGVQSDDDWYRIDVTNNFQRMLVDCRFNHNNGNIDIAIYNSAGYLLDSAESATNDEYLDYVVPTGGIYYIRVYGSNAGAVYNLWWDDVEPSQYLAIGITEPDGINDGVIQGEEYIIRWLDWAPYINASISLYYDTDNLGEDGTLIVSGLSENSPTNNYVWDTSAITPGDYYIYGILNEGVSSQVIDYSGGMVTILTICTEILCNPGFEDGLDYWVSNGTSNNQVSTDAAEGINSLQSEQIRTSSEVPSWAGIKQPINSVEPAQTYGLSLWAKGQDAARGHTKVVWFDSGDSIVQVDYPIININGTFDWINLSKLVTSPPDAVSAELYIWHGLDAVSKNSAGSTLWIDDINFEAATGSCGTLCNESFEYGTLYWTTSGPAGSHLIMIGDAHEGDKVLRSAQLYTSLSPVKWAGVRQYAQVKEGEEYRLRLWLKSLDASDGHVRVIWRDASGNNLNTEYPISGINGTDLSWFLRESTLTAPSGAVKAEITIWHGVTGGTINAAGSTLWIDNVTMICLSLCNGGFEDGSVHWETQLPNRGEIITTDVYEGIRSMKTVQAKELTDITQWTGVNQRTLVVGGNSYDLSFWIKKENTAQGHVKIKWRDSNDQLISQQFPISGMNGTNLTWTQMNTTITAPASAETVEIFIWHGVDGSNNNATGSTLYLDNVTFTQI